MYACHSQTGVTTRIWTANKELKDDVTPNTAARPADTKLNSHVAAEEEVKTASVRSVSKLVGDRPALLADLRKMQETCSRTDELSLRLRKPDERLNAEAEAVQGLIAQNAGAKQYQDDYNSA